ncbi:MAG: AMP-binding protein [Gammaproteobacteria bacterium]
MENCIYKEYTVDQALRTLSEQYQHRTALVNQDGDTVTFLELHEASLNVKHLLQNRNIQPPDRIGLILEQGLTMTVTCLGIMSYCICVPVNPALTPREISSLFNKHGIKTLVSSNNYRSLIEEIASNYDLDVIYVNSDILYSKNAGAGLLSNSVTNNNIALVLHTSGSTSEPKAVALTHYQLIHSAENVINSLRLTSKDTCLHVMPPFHIGAIVDLTLAPLLSGGVTIISNDANADNFWGCYKKFKPTWYQGVPTMLKAIVDSEYGNLEEHHDDLRFIRSVSSKLPSALSESLISKFQVPVIEIYGMTEAAGVITSNPFLAIKPGSVGTSAGPEIKILDPYGNEQKKGDVGEILIRGNTVITAYDEDDDINTASFIGGWLRTGDLGFVDKDDYLYITGRSKEIINRGGEKISPLEIDNLLDELDGIVEAACFAIPHPTLGEELAVAVVKEEDSSISEKVIQAYLTQKIAAFKRPKAVYFIDQLPRAPGGKLRRHKIADSVNCNKYTNTKKSQAVPDNKLARRLEDIWRAVLNTDEVLNSDNFFENGGDSLKAATLMSRLEKEFKFSLPTAILFDKPDFYSLYAYIHQRLNEDAANTANNFSNALSPSLETGLLQQMQAWPGKRLHQNSLINGFNTLGSLPPLFWSCQRYEEILPIVEKLGSEQPVYVMRSLNELVKRKQRDYLQLAKRYLDDVLAIKPQGPFYLGGFCGGARVAYELANLLKESGQEIKLLCLHEKNITRSYSGRTALFCCTESKYSPYGLYNFPELGFQHYFSNLSVYKYDCEHAAFYKGDSKNHCTQQFLEDLRNELAYARENIQSPKRFHPTATVSTDIGHFSMRQLKIMAPRLMAKNSLVAVKIIIKNTSDRVWETTSESGITLSARLVNIRRRIKIGRAGFSMIEIPIPPGGKASFEFQIQTTKTSGLRRLEIDLLREGISWINSNRPDFGQWILVK